MSAQGLARPRNLAIAGVVGTGLLFTFFPRSRAQVLPETFETPAVQQIGNRYSAGGGTKTHAPAVATRRGDEDHQESPQQDMKGAGTVHFNEKLADQKTDVQTPPAKAFNKQNLGSERGK